MSLLHVLMLPIFLISVTSPFTRLMYPYELASFQVSASKKALKNAWIRSLHTPLPFLSPIPLLNTEGVISATEMVLYESPRTSLVLLLDAAKSCYHTCIHISERV